MSRILAVNVFTSSELDYASDPVKLPRHPFAGAIIISFENRAGNADSFGFTVEQAPTSSGPWSPTATHQARDDDGSFLNNLTWATWSATAPYVRLRVTTTAGDDTNTSALWTDDALLHWEPTP